MERRLYHNMATLTQDETGAYTDQGNTPVDNNRSISGLNGGASGSTPDGSNLSSNDKFNLALMGILRQAQSVGSTAPLYASEDELQNEKLNLSNPLASTAYAPLFQGMGYASTAAEKDTQNAFNPGITSINSQIQAENDAETKFNDMANTAETIVQNNKNIVAPGQSIVDNNGNVLYQGHSYTPTPNPQTGTIDGFDQTTGQWLSDVQNQSKQNTNPPPAGSNVVVGGIDFSGASTGVTSYAKDPNYSTEVNGIYQALQKGMPVPNAQALDTYIQGHAKGSGVTGSMIMNAATTYGVDPTALASVLAQESDFGTAGAGAKTNNPGNVGNTDGGVTTSFPSVQKGVNAAAMELAKRMPGNANAGKPSGSLAGSTVGTSTSPTGGQFSDVATTKISQLPTGMRPYVQAGPQGVAYIDSTKVPAEFQSIVQAQSAKTGIPYLDAQDVQNIKAIGNIYEAIGNMQSTIKSTLNSGLVGGTYDVIKTGINDITHQNAFPNLATYNSYRDAAIKAVTALAGGSGSGLRLNTGEIDSSVNTLPDSGSSLETANTKIGALLKLLNTQLAGTFPYIQGGQPGANGTGNTPSTGVTKSGISYTIQ